MRIFEATYKDGNEDVVEPMATDERHGKEPFFLGNAKLVVQFKTDWPLEERQMKSIANYISRECYPTENWILESVTEKE